MTFLSSTGSATKFRSSATNKSLSTLFEPSLLPFGRIDRARRLVIINLMQSLAQRVVLKFLLVAALPIAASAAEIHLCTTCDPTLTPITATNGALNDVQAYDTTGGGLTLEFINLTGSIMDNLEFGTTIAALGSLDPTQEAALASDFTCAVDTGLFLNCAVLYDPTTGALDFDYYGVNPPNILDTPGFVILEDYLGQGFGDTGIPNLGVFEVQLSDWMPNFIDTNVSPTYLYGGPDCTNCVNGFAPMQNSYNVPEPSAALILLTELLLLGGVLAVFGRKLKWKQRFDL
jgi:hypothetical protein